MTNRETDKTARSNDYEVTVPDVGEGVAEVEIVSWQVSIGDRVRRREIVAEVMTDKATVEVPSPVDGTITSLGGDIGDILAVGSPLFNLDVGSRDQDAPPVVSPPTPPVVVSPPPPRGVQRRPHATGETPAADRPQLARYEPSPRQAPQPGNGEVADRPRATPAVRRRARDLGINLAFVTGSGPAGRVTNEDLDAWAANPTPAAFPGPGAAPVARRQRSEITDQPLIGLRRKISQRMVAAATTIPHITYVEEVDITNLENLRAQMNRAAPPDSPRLTLLPFLVRAIVNEVPNFEMMNAHLIDGSDDGKETLRLFAPVHVGIATQTDAGLVVPVLRHAEAETVWSSAARIAKLAEATRSGDVSADDLTGSTITITSLGRLGGLVSTPVINKPETAIVGVNKIVTRPVWNQGAGTFEPRQIMNLSSSFDHRVVDGFDAASFVQALRVQLEQPALLFVENPP